MAGVITNPIVFMTVLGIIANFVFEQKVPLYLDNILTVLGKENNQCSSNKRRYFALARFNDEILIGQSFAGTALFCLGHSMVLKGGSSVKGNIVTLSLLIAAKM